MNLELEPFLQALLWANLRVALLVALVWSILIAVGPRAGSFRYSVWFTAMTGCLAFPLMSVVLPPVAIPILPPEVAPVSEAAVQAYLSDAPVSTIGLTDLATLLAFVYGLGFVSVLGCFCVSVVRLARLERAMSPWGDTDLLDLNDSLRDELGIARPVEVLCSDSIDSPYTWGTLRPRVVLPAAARSWSLECKRNALLHELGHIRRFDWSRLCVLRLAAALYWFNPLVWIVIRECSYEAERACDDVVLQSGGRSTEYAEQLVALMASSRDSSRFGIALGGARFGRRVRSILRSSREATAMSRLKSGCVLAATVVSIIVLAACQATGQTVDPASLEAERQARVEREQAELERLRQDEQQRAEAAQARLGILAQAEAAQTERELAATYARQQALAEALRRVQAQAREASQRAMQAQEQAQQIMQDALRQAEQARQQAGVAQQQARQAMEQSLQVLEQMRDAASRPEAQPGQQANEAEQG